MINGVDYIPCKGCGRCGTNLMKDGVVNPERGKKSQKKVWNAGEKTKAGCPDWGAGANWVVW